MLFICEKCGYIGNSADHNNFYKVAMNKAIIESGKHKKNVFKPEYEYFDTHMCCADCCNGIEYIDGRVIRKDIFDTKPEEKVHWTDYGREKLLNENMGIINAKDYFENLDKQEGKE